MELETLGPLIGPPWIYVLVGLSVLLDVFLPVLPSGVLMVTAATAAAGAKSAAEAVGGPGTGFTDLPDLLGLVLCAAIASLFGDLVAYRLAWRGGDRFDRAVSRSRRLKTAQARLGDSQVRGALVVVARFAPAGRSVVSLGAGAMRQRVVEFLPWSALAGVAWAGYSVVLGYFGGRWFGANWLSVAVSVLALLGAGTCAAYLVRRPAQRRSRAEGHA